MSDLSVPPLSLVPAPGAADPPRADREPFEWPTPELPRYPAPAVLAYGEPCVVEGLNGSSMAGRMLQFDPFEAVVHLQVPPSRTATLLRFSQFRRLHLAKPLQTAVLDTEDTAPLPLGDERALAYKIDLKVGTPMEGLTLSYQEETYGIFLFEPVDGEGTVRRVFVPHAAYRRADIGPRLGEVLVDQKLVAPADVDAALQDQQRLRKRKLGELLLVQQIITADELMQAVEQQSRMPMVRIGEALTGLGLISPEQLDEALKQQRSDRTVPLGELLVQQGKISRSDLQTALARKMGYPLVDAMNFPVEADAVGKLPYGVAARLPALPLILRGGRLIVALEDPTRHSAVDEIEFAAQCKVVPVLARAGTLSLAIDRAYERMGIETQAARGGGNAGGDLVMVEYNPEDAGRLLATLEQEQAGDNRGAATDDESGTIEQSDNSLVRLINTMIVEAQTQGVSDIHIECPPGREKVRVRFRKDGQLRPYLELPHTYRNALVARIKIMCDLDISERRKPQDGKINFGKFVQGQRLELRVATVPTFGNLEDVVMRLLASAKPLPLAELGLSPDNLRRLDNAVQRPYGMLLCVGPTGSGKTTTLHSALGHINRPDRKIWTAEDPIEITQPGLRQVQVNPKINWTFERALRAFLRADPDVIMVGEIRDRETAQVAIEASLTGHLVMSTLHTNSAPETVTRLLDMGMDPFNFADALLAVLAQRLVRRACPHCRSTREATASEIDELLGDYLHAMRELDPPPDPAATLAAWRERWGVAGKLMRHESRGCAKCDNTGLRGRAGLHELLEVTPRIRRLIQTGARAEELQRAAIADGMRTLRQDGIEKVLAGVTTIAEVRSTTNS